MPHGKPTRKKQRPNYGNAIQRPKYGNAIQRLKYGNAIQCPKYGNAIKRHTCKAAITERWTQQQKRSRCVATSPASTVNAKRVALSNLAPLSSVPVATPQRGPALQRFGDNRARVATRGCRDARARCSAVSSVATQRGAGRL